MSEKIIPFPAYPEQETNKTSSKPIYLTLDLKNGQGVTKQLKIKFSQKNEILEKYLTIFSQDEKNEIYISLNAITSLPPEKALKPLEKLATKLPTVLPISHLLAMLYKELSHHDEARQIFFHLNNQFPEFVLGKTAYAMSCLKEGAFHKVPEIFHQKTILPLLYPKRKVFFLPEVISFHETWTLYHQSRNEPQDEATHQNLLKNILALAQANSLI